MVSLQPYVLELIDRGFLSLGQNCVINHSVLFEPLDLKGNKLPIVVADNCRIMAGTIIYGGVFVGEKTIIEEHCIVGKQEFGYAVGQIYHGDGVISIIGNNVIVRAGAHLYGGTQIGNNTTIGHHTLLRSFVRVGEHTQIAHSLSIERETIIGNYVRCSPLSHITSSVVIEDRVFLGAGVMTINDKGMIWKDTERQPELLPPYFEYGAKIGSGSIIQAGVRIGRQALIGSGSLVTRDVPSFAIAYGCPAKVQGYVKQKTS